MALNRTPGRRTRGGTSLTAGAGVPKSTLKQGPAAALAWKQAQVAASAPSSGLVRPHPEAGGVKIEPVTSDQTVKTHWGADLTAKAGRDVIVSRSPEDRWVVRKDIADSVYQKGDDGLYAKRSNLAFPYTTAEHDQTVDTLEGPVKASKGDKIMVGTAGERWPVKPEQFGQKYSPVSVHAQAHAEKALTDAQRSAVSSTGSGTMAKKTPDQAAAGAKATDGSVTPSSKSGKSKARAAQAQGLDRPAPSTNTLRGTQNKANADAIKANRASRNKSVLAAQNARTGTERDVLVRSATDPKGFRVVKESQVNASIKAALPDRGATAERKVSLAPKPYSGSDGTSPGYMPDGAKPSRYAESTRSDMQARTSAALSETAPNFKGNFSRFTAKVGTPTLALAAAASQGVNAYKKAREGGASKGEAVKAGVKRGAPIAALTVAPQVAEKVGATIKDIGFGAAGAIADVAMDDPVIGAGLFMSGASVVPGAFAAAGAAGKALEVAGKVAGKVAVPLTIATSGYEGVKGYKAEQAKRGKGFGPLGATKAVADSLTFGFATATARKLKSLLPVAGQKAVDKGLEIGSKVSDVASRNLPAAPFSPSMVPALVGKAVEHAPAAFAKANAAFHDHHMTGHAEAAPSDGTVHQFERDRRVAATGQVVHETVREHQRKGGAPLGAKD